ADPDPAEKKVLEKNQQDLKTIAGWLSRHPRRSTPDQAGAEFKKGFNTYLARNCQNCHTYEGQGGKRGPDLTGYGDAEWLRLMIMAPAHERRYGLTNAMPAFRDLEGPAGAVAREEIRQVKDLHVKLLKAEGRKKPRPADVEKAHQVVHLSDRERELIIRWL